MISGSCFRTKDTFTHFRHIQVCLQNSFLSPDPFDHECEIHFESLSNPASSLPEEYIFRNLLADGGCSPHSAGLSFVVVHSFLYALEIESCVIREQLIFTGNDCQFDIRRYLRCVHIVPFQTVSVKKTTQLGKGYGRIYPFQQYDVNKLK